MQLVPGDALRDQIIADRVGALLSKREVMRLSAGSVGISDDADDRVRRGMSVRFFRRLANSSSFCLWPPLSTDLSISKPSSVIESEGSSFIGVCCTPGAGWRCMAGAARRARNLTVRRVS